MPHFLVKLNPPRPTFSQDMTPREREVMQEHVAYWSKLANEGHGIVFGPVADPQGVWGVAIAEAADRAEVDLLTTNDPAVREALEMRYDVYPMPIAILGRR